MSQFYHHMVQMVKLVKLSLTICSTERANVRLPQELKLLANAVAQRGRRI